MISFAQKCTWIGFGASIENLQIYWTLHVIGICTILILRFHQKAINLIAPKSTTGILLQLFKGSSVDTYSNYLRNQNPIRSAIKASIAMILIADLDESN